MDNIRENLTRLSELNEDELSALQNAVVNEFGAVEGQDPTREVVEIMEELANANDEIVAEQTRRGQEAEELALAAEAAISRFKGGEGDDEETPEAPAEGEEIVDEGEKDEAPAKSDKEAPESDEEDEDGKKKKKEDNLFASNSADTSINSPEAAEAALVESKVPAEKDNLVPASTDPIANLDSDKGVAQEAHFHNENKDHVLEFPKTSEEKAAEPAPDRIPNLEEKSANAEDNTESSEGPVTASNTPNDRAFEAPADHAPVVAHKASVTIQAGSDLPGITAGAELSGLSDVAQALLSRKHGMGRTSGGDGEQHTVATFSTSYPDNRMLSANDIEGNRAKINAVVSPEAITAAGGLTAPVETSYDIFELGHTNVRPVRDSLAVFGADRGGLRFMTPPVLSDLEGAASVWTLQDDIDAASTEGPNPVKPCLRVQAGVEVTVYTDAIPLCLTFGNLGARAYPELVERHTQLGMTEHARFAEIRLLTRIGALSTNVTADSELGAARDIFVQLEQAAAAYRSRYRLDPNAPLRVMFPEWFKNALRADLTKQIPGDGRDGTFNLAEAEINSWFAARNINVTWFIDGETGQVFGEQTAGALLDFPDTVIWYLFSEGTFVFLDGGTLDLGLVRDSTLNGTNDYKIFLETFEGVAKVGVESLRVTSALAIKGSTSATTVVGAAA